VDKPMSTYKAAILSSSFRALAERDHSPSRRSVHDR
jgi:hypothetical protein